MLKEHERLVTQWPEPMTLSFARTKPFLTLITSKRVLKIYRCVHKYGTKKELISITLEKSFLFPIFLKLKIFICIQKGN